MKQSNSQRNWHNMAMPNYDWITVVTCPIKSPHGNCIKFTSTIFVNIVHIKVTIDKNIDLHSKLVVNLVMMNKFLFAMNTDNY